MYRDQNKALEYSEAVIKQNVYFLISNKNMSMVFGGLIYNDNAVNLYDPLRKGVSVYYHNTWQILPS